MIVLTRLNGVRFGINDEQIERLEEGPETVIVLVNGNRYTARESLDEVVDAIVDYRSRVLNAASVAEPDELEARREASVSLFRPHSVLGDVQDAVEIGVESPIPGKRVRRPGKLRGKREDG